MSENRVFFSSSVKSSHVKNIITICVRRRDCLEERGEKKRKKKEKKASSLFGVSACRRKGTKGKERFLKQSALLDEKRQKIFDVPFFSRTSIGSTGRFGNLDTRVAVLADTSVPKARIRRKDEEEETGAREVSRNVRAREREKKKNTRAKKRGGAENFDSSRDWAMMSNRRIEAIGLKNNNKKKRKTKCVPEPFARPLARANTCSCRENTRPECVCVRVREKRQSGEGGEREKKSAPS